MNEKEIKRLLRELATTNAEPVRKFEIRSYGKSELAMMYFPHTKTPKGALNNLNFWIDYNGELRQKLRELKSPPQAKRFTKREVELIVEYLCEP